MTLRTGHPNTSSVDIPRGRGAFWMTREAMAQIARQLVIASQNSTTLLVTPGQDGWTLYVPPSAATTTTIIKIKSGTGQDYVADVYDNGPDAGATDTSVAVKALDLAVGETIPADTLLLARPLRWHGAGESSSSSSDGDGDGSTVYVVDVPRWI